VQTHGLNNADLPAANIFFRVSVEPAGEVGENGKDERGDWQV
jgi:hypothetical protein